MLFLSITFAECMAFLVLPCGKTPIDPGSSKHFVAITTYSKAFRHKIRP